MKTKLFGIIRKAALPVMLAGATFAFSPVSAMAAEFHGGGGHGEARGFARGGGERGGYAAPAYRGGDRGYRGGYGGGWRGGVYVTPYAYGPGYGYGYVAPAPGPCGYYDQFGYWHADPNCYLPY